MMTTQSSHTKVMLKKLAVIPLLAGFIFLFAERVEAQEKQEIIETIYEQPKSEQKKLTDTELYKKYYHRRGRFMFKDKNGKEISKKYSELTEDEKKRIIPPPPLKSKKKIPTQKLIDNLKDGKKYAIWIDGKVVKNEILNNYKSSDFSNHFVSFVYKNARSKRFPQKYQASLDTHKYFETQNKKRVKDFMNYLKKEYKIIEDTPTPKSKTSKHSFSEIKLEDVKELFNKVNEPFKVYKRLNKYYEAKRNKKPHFIKSSNERQKELKESFSHLGSLYFKLSKENKRKTKKPIHPHNPYLKLRKNNKVFYKLRKDLTKEDKLLIPPPPPMPNASKEEILKAKKAYKDWKKRTGNDGSPPPKKKINKELEKYKKANNIYDIPKPRKKRNTKHDTLPKNKIVFKQKDGKVITLLNNINLSKEQINKANVTYYLDGKSISKKELKDLKTYNIKSLRVEKDKNNKGSGSIYIISKK